MLGGVVGTETLIGFVGFQNWMVLESERFMASWHKAEEAASRKRAIKRGDNGPGHSNSSDMTPTGREGGGRKRRGMSTEIDVETEGGGTGQRRDRDGF